MRVESGNDTSANVLKNTRSGGNYEIERTKLKISTMTSVGDLEESIFLHESVIHGHHAFKDVWLTLTTFILRMCLINHALVQEGSMRLISA